MTLYTHQESGIDFLAKRTSALLGDEMGLGKSRQALLAAKRLFDEEKISSVLVLCPAAVKISWQEEIVKLNSDQESFFLGKYDPKSQKFFVKLGAGLLNVVLVSYALLPQERHVKELIPYCSNSLLVCDESVFLKNRTAKQTKGAIKIGRVAKYRWLLNGTPVANGPLDLYAQGLVMFDGLRGALRGFQNWYHFRARYGVMGGWKGKNVVAYQRVPELTKRFAPYVLRREKRDCLDLPAKSYTTREVALKEETWKVYQELKREALLALPDEALKPEPNAAVRLLRLCQLTSGHVGVGIDEELEQPIWNCTRDVSIEKLAWITAEIAEGELSSTDAIIIWCRWRRERERLQKLLALTIDDALTIDVYRVFGGQQAKNRSADIQAFQTSTNRRVLVGQIRAGGYGLNLTAASTVVYLSNTFSYVDRIQSEDRVHRIGQTNPCLYIDVLATGPNGQRTVDHHVLACLRAKRDVAELTCAEWRTILEEDK
jgi:SNF2 family DNA or RNA helicase